MRRLAYSRHDSRCYPDTHARSSPDRATSVQETDRDRLTSVSQDYCYRSTVLSPTPTHLAALYHALELGLAPHNSVGEASNDLLGVRNHAVAELLAGRDVVNQAHGDTGPGRQRLACR